MRIGILGAGLSGVSLACLLQDWDRVTRIELLEKESRPGGLCRSFPFGNVQYDIGPHIIFSKNAEVLRMMLDVLGDNSIQLRRSSKIFHEGRFVKYPFENELSALSAQQRDYCLHSFLRNPYQHYVPQNMLQFFLATFGEGITNLYLRPYNEKIWKFDPAFMDTQMVDRIPKPPAEDIIRSAKGIPTEGYLHQLYFHYPKTGGIQALVEGLRQRLGPKVEIRLHSTVTRVEKRAGRWQVHTSDGRQNEYDRLVSTIPLPELIETLGPVVPGRVVAASRSLKFNSITVCVLRVKGDNLGDNLSFMVADGSVLFHRVSKVNFLFPTRNDGTTTLMAEVTHREGDRIGQMGGEDIMDQVVQGLQRLRFISNRRHVLAREARSFKYAYVIYDLAHRRNVRVVRDFCRNELGLVLHGRFAEFEYLNMDAIVQRSIEKNRETRQAWQDRLQPAVAEGGISPSPVPDQW